MLLRIALSGVIFFNSICFASSNRELTLTPEDTSNPPNPWVSGILGAVIPGAGYLYNGDSTKAALGFTAMAGMIYPHFAPPTTDAGRTGTSMAFLVSRNVYGYTVYDSFQDALDKRGRPKLLVDNPHYSFGEMVTAPFKLSNYKSKKVWIPLAVLGGLMASAVVGTFETTNHKVDAGKLAWGLPLIAVTTAIIGAGEEADFRGYYYPALSQATGNVYIGGVAQAILFGYQHTGWPGRGFPIVSGPLVREATGLYEPPDFDAKDITKFVATFVGGLHHAWITSEEGLLPSVAHHAAWDFIILAGQLIATNEAPPIVFSLTF